jgi:hypothetical protein
MSLPESWETAGPGSAAGAAVPYGRRGQEMDEITLGRVRTRICGLEQNLGAVPGRTPARQGQATVALTTGQQGCEPMTGQVHDREDGARKRAVP